MKTVVGRPGTKTPTSPTPADNNPRPIHAVLANRLVAGVAMWGSGGCGLTVMNIDWILGRLDLIDDARNCSRGFGVEADWRRWSNGKLSSDPLMLRFDLFFVMRQ